MGNTHFAPPTYSRLSFFAMDFKQNIFNDDIVIVYNVDEVVPILTNCIQTVLKKGLDKTKQVTNTIVKLKLSSDVIRDYNDSKSALQSNALLCSIFNDLLRHGWRLKASTNIRRKDKRCTLFFHKDPSLGPGASCGEWMAVCLKSDDKLCVANARPGVKEAVRAEIVRTWSAGVQDEEDYGDGNVKFKLNGYPWLVHTFCDELRQSRELVMNVVRALEPMGFQFYASSHPAGDTKAVDTIYLNRPEKIEPMGEAFVLGLLKDNEIYLVRASSMVIDAVRRCVTTFWQPGIKSDRTDGQLCVLKLHGSPWTSDAAMRKMARVLILRTFEELCKAGWRIHSTLDLSRNIDDVSCFLMMQGPAEANNYMAISLHRHNRMRLLNAPPDVERLFTEELPKEWPESITNKEKFASPEITLPSDFSDCIGVFCIILDRLQSRGWNLVSSADLSANYITEHRENQSDKEYPDDLHTLILEKRGAPVGVGGDEPFAIGFEGYAMKM